MCTWAATKCFRSRKAALITYCLKGTPHTFIATIEVPQKKKGEIRSKFSASLLSTVLKAFSEGQSQMSQVHVACFSLQQE